MQLETEIVLGFVEKYCYRYFGWQLQLFFEPMSTLMMSDGTDWSRLDLIIIGEVNLREKKFM